jgi:mono/diheme cytochrome c family protein
MRFVSGLIIGVALVPIAFYFYMQSGQAPVATSAPPMPMEKVFASSALHAKLREEAPKTASIPADETALLAGVRVYRDDCAVCHGLPHQPVTAVAKGMYPGPPQLFQRDAMVTDDPAGVTFWKAKYGIRLSGMPGFQASLSDEQLWQVSLLLAGADKLPTSVQQALNAPSSTGDTSK